MFIKSIIIIIIMRERRGESSSPTRLLLDASLANALVDAIARRLKDKDIVLTRKVMHIKYCTKDQILTNRYFSDF